MPAAVEAAEAVCPLLDGHCLCVPRRYYDRFTNCSEVEANLVGCHWPNPLAQSFLSSMHQRFFSNCSLDRTQWEDPPEEVLVPLIALPVLLTVAMAGLVMWRSKHSDPQS